MEGEEGFAVDGGERELILDRIVDEADALDPGPAEGCHPVHDHRPDAGRLYKLATGRVVEIAPFVEPWLASRSLAPKAKDMARADPQLLARHRRTVQEGDGAVRGGRSAAGPETRHRPPR